MYHVSSLEDPRLAAYHNMKERTLRGESLFITEGLLLAERLLASRFRTESLLITERMVEQVQPLVPPEIPVYVAPDALIVELVGFPFHRGVLAVGHRGETLSLEQLLEGVPTKQGFGLVVCPQVTQAENLGLLFRTAAAFGVDGILLGPQCCDPFARRALRLSMGGVLRVPFLKSADLTTDLARLKEEWGFQCVATVLDAEAERLTEARWAPRTALLFGNEFEGLSDQWLALCDRRLTIPMQPGTDSLNLGVAAGIFIYAWKQGSSLPH